MAETPHMGEDDKGEPERERQKVRESGPFRQAPTPTSSWASTCLEAAPFLQVHAPPPPPPSLQPQERQGLAHRKAGLPATPE